MKVSQIGDNITFTICMYIFFFIKTVRIALLHFAVNGRKKSLIKRVLEELCFSNGTDGEKAKCLLEKGVLLVTLNDDPETLEDVLNWAVDRGFRLSWEQEECIDKHCPVLLACHQNYIRCISVLYKFGYQILLPDEDRDTIRTILETENAVINDWYFYYTLYFGNDAVRQRGMRLHANTLDLIDPIERFLKFKAVANPHYILTEFLENPCHTPQLLRLYDPIRRSLALARYSRHLSQYYVYYAQEYKEISKVKIRHSQTFLNK